MQNITKPIKWKKLDCFCFVGFDFLSNFILVLHTVSPCMWHEISRTLALFNRIMNDSSMRIVI